MVDGGEVHPEIAPAGMDGLDGLDPAEAGVVEVHDHHRQPQTRQGLELAGAHAEAAVTGERHHQLVGAGYLGADGGRDGISEAAVGPGDDHVAAGPAHVVVRGGVRGGRARVGDDDGVLGEHPAERGHHPVRLEWRLVTGGLLGHRRPPLGPKGRDPLRDAGVGLRVARAHHGRQIGEDQLGVAHQPHVGGVVVADELRVDVQMDHPRSVVRIGQAPLDRGDGPGLAADVEEEIRFRHQAVRVVAVAVVAHHANGQRVVLRDGALAGDGGAHRGGEHLGQNDQLVPSTGVDDPAAGDDDRALGRQKEAGGLFEEGTFGAPTIGGIPAAGRLGVDVAFPAGHFAVQDLLREGHVHGAGPTGGGHAEGPPERVGDLVVALYEMAPLRDALVEHVVIELGDGALALGGQVDARGERDHRHRGTIGFGDPRHRVEGAGAGGTLADPRFEGEPCVGVGGEGGRALVPAQDVGYPVAAVVQGLVQLDAGVARDAEDVFHAVLDEHLDDDIAAPHTAPHA